MNQLALAPVQEITSLHHEIVAAAVSSLEKATRIGELLTQERVRLEHGQWLPWIKKNLPFTDRTARNYLRVYNNRDKIKTETVSDLTGAYRLLSERDRPDDLINNLPDAKLLAEDITPEGQKRHDAVHEALRVYINEQMERLEGSSSLVEVAEIHNEATRLLNYCVAVKLYAERALGFFLNELETRGKQFGLTLKQMLKFTSEDWERLEAKAAK